jgi:NO-binding membrane sensor protein with MHYT domain
MAHVHHFAHGWINPALAFVMSFLGWLLGLALVDRARQATGGSRARWLLVAAIAIGGVGTWLMQFMALLGFDVPGTTLRYDLPTTLIGLAIAVGAFGIGLLIVGYGRLAAPRVVIGGLITGLGVAAMHNTGVAAVRISGELSVEPRAMLLSVVAAVLGSMLALSLVRATRGGGATLAAAGVMALVACGTHYSAMAAVRVDLTDTAPGVGVSPFVLLTPVSLLACVVIALLAYATVGSSAQLDDVFRGEDMLPQVRERPDETALALPYQVRTRYR